MKKSFDLTDPKHEPARVVEAIKHQLRKYIRRERRKAVPEEFDFWAFDCKVGREGPEREVAEKDLGRAIDEAAAAQWEAIYVEVVATPVKRAGKAIPSSS
ncbi:MAG: DUF6172 family protein [Nannocystaceae bacterium]|nr:DUF6172 family protein [bacterium]